MRRLPDRRRRYDELQELDAHLDDKAREVIRSRQERLLARRLFLQRAAALGGAAVVGPSLAAFLAACGGESPKQAAPGAIQQATGAASSGQQMGKATIIREDYPTYPGTPTFKPGSKVTIGSIIDNPYPLNPIAPTFAQYYGLATWMYDWLIDLDPVTLDVIPAVAKTWQISSDGRTYTFNLRDDAQFWDGSPVTSEDVAFTMLAYRDEPESALTAVYKPVAKVDTPDKLTVIVTLERPFSPFLAWGGQMFIAPKKEYEAYKGRLQDAPAGQRPLGSGGYKWVETVPGSHTRLAANREWWRGGGWRPDAGRGGPYIETVIHKHYKDANAWLLGFLAGEVDTIYPVAPKDVESLGQVDTWIYDTRSTVTETMLFNFDNPDRPNKTLFADLKVRQAMAYSVDYEKMGKAVWRGYWEPRWSMELHPWMLKPIDEQQGYTYDPKKAADLFAQAGWKKGSDGVLTNDKGEKFKILGISGATYLAPDYAQIVQQFLKEAGVDMEYRTLESGPLREAYRTTHKWDVAFARKWGWGYPESFRDITTGSTPPVGLNFGAYTNAEVDKLWDQILTTLDQKAAIPLFHKLQDIQAEELPRLWFGAPHDVVAIRKHILGHQPNPMWQDWDPVWWYVA